MAASEQWTVLPCVESTAAADWVVPLRAAEPLVVLPVARIATLLYRVQSDNPDAIVLAANMNAAAFQREGMRQIFEDTPTVLLGEEPSRAMVRSAARMHIYSVVPLSASPQQLAAAIAATIAGFAVTLPRLPAGLPDTVAGGESLTPRELEILRLMARGQRNKQIAVRLNLSQHTVKYHVSSVMAKLGARTRTEAVTIGVLRGLVAI